MFLLCALILCTIGHTFSSQCFDEHVTNKSVHKLSLEHLGINRVEPQCFRGMDKLNILRLSHNVIATLEDSCFSALTSLRVLFLDHNSLIVLTRNCLRGLTLLTYLDISHNPLKEIKGFDLPNLTHLLARSTQLEKFLLNLSSTKIVSVNLSRGLLQEIDFALFPRNFTDLDLSHNRISSTQNWETLEGDKVILKKNNITQLSCYPRVGKLILTYNRLKNLVDNSTNSNDKIEILNLGFNQISQLKAEQFWGLNNLKLLNLQNNFLTDLNRDTFKHCSKLETLDLALNKFQNVDREALSCLRNLKTLYISRKDLDHLDRCSIANGTLLRFDHNRNDFFSVKQSNKKLTPEFCRQHPLYASCPKPLIQTECKENHVLYLV